MNGKHAIQKILSQTSAFYALVGGSEAVARVYYNRATQKDNLPHCIVRLQSTEPNDTKSGASTLDFNIVQVLHIATTENITQQMAAAARAALDRVATATYNTVNLVSIQFQDSDDFQDQVDDVVLYTTEQIYKVMIRP